MVKILTGRLILLRLIMLSAMLALVAIGILTVFAIGNPANTDQNKFADSWKKQTVYAALGLLAIVIVNLVEYRRFGPLAYPFYAAILALLAILLLELAVQLIGSL